MTPKLPATPDDSEEALVGDAEDEALDDLVDDEALDDAIEDAIDDDDEEEGDGDEEDDGEEDEGEAKKKKKKKKADDDDEDEVVEFADHPLPKKKDILKALQWAFEGEDVPPDYLERCCEHAMLVQKGNRRMNLTKIVEPKEIAAKHYLDSWRAVRLLPLLGRTVLDLGTGGGYPGIPVALAEPNASVVLIDSTQKKAEFVAQCIETMGIPNARAIWGRAEEHMLRDRYDVVILRAISSVRENVRLLRKVRHSLHDLVMMKGSSWSREVRAGEREAERLGFRLDTVWEHELPDEMGGRAVLIYRAPGGQGR